MEKRNIWIAGLLAIALIGAASYSGSLSHDAAPIALDNQHATTSQIAPKVEEPSAVSSAKEASAKPIQENAQASIITNSDACLSIAKLAIQSEEAAGIMQGIKVTQAHFKQSTGNCYYEIQYPLNGDIMTSIHYAPNDETIATCAQVSGNCYQSGYGYINESSFLLIEAQYLAN